MVAKMASYLVEVAAGPKESLRGVIEKGILPFK